jgi:COMPASS component SPP1
VKKSISAGVSRSRSTSVMPRGSVGPDGDYKADADETAVGEDDRNHEDDSKLYCVCKTKYDEDRVMIACDRCASATSGSLSGGT